MPLFIKRAYDPPADEDGVRVLVDRRGPVTLVYAANDAEHNNAVGLREFLDRRHAPKRAAGSSRGRSGSPARQRRAPRRV